MKRRPPHHLSGGENDLPFALEFCERSVLIDEGRVVADGRTRDLLGDTGLLASHGLELPYKMMLDPDAA